MVSIDQRAYLAEALLDFIHKNGGADAQLYLPAVAVLPKVTQGCSKLQLNHAEPLPALAQVPDLAPDTRIQDGFLATLLHFCHATGMPATCLLLPGNKLPALPQQQKASADVGLEYVNNLAQNLADIMELPYDRSSCSAASVQLLPHTQSDDAAATAGHRSGVVQDSIMYL
eukprot:jgi/Chrzof1/14075/Cz08g24080.t1